MSAVLVVRPSSLGDIVHALALVADIREHRPELAIDWVAEDAFASLVALDPRHAARDSRCAAPLAAPTVRPEARGARRPRSAATLRRERLRRRARSAGAGEGRDLTWLARGPRHGPDRASIREPIATLAHDHHHAIDPDQHLIDRCRQLAAARAGLSRRRAAAFRPRGAAAGGRRADSRSAVSSSLLHATSRDDKLWPETHWRALIASFARAGFAIVLPWGDERERARSERLAASEPRASVPPRQSLPALATLLARAELVVGVDTGLVHLAAALGTPTVSLFVATDPRLARRRARERAWRAISAASASIPTVADVEAAAGELLRRAPRC